MTLKSAGTIVDTIWEYRKKPAGWIVIAALVAYAGLSAWVKAGDAVTWVKKTSAHVEAHAPVDVKALKAQTDRIEAKVDQQGATVNRMDGRLERIEDAIIRERVKR